MYELQQRRPGVMLLSGNSTVIASTCSRTNDEYTSVYIECIRKNPIGDNSSNGVFLPNAKAYSVHEKPRSFDMVNFLIL